jgi:rhodanese-related sulfurtransferase
MNGSTAESETPEEMGRRQFLACACGTQAAPLAVVIGYSLAASLVGPIYRKFKLQVSKTPRFSSAQAIGLEGVDKRIDVLATALKAGMTVHDLAELELAYAPPYGSAKDPVNLAGMTAQNVLAGDVALARWDEIASLDPITTFLLDVRRPDERALGFIPGSAHIPLDELRQRLSELPRDREIIAYCQSGQRSYIAARILSQHGFRMRNLTGAYRTWRATQPQ